MSGRGATAVPAETVMGVACDVFSPNALGAVLDEEGIARLDCAIVAGAANNQLGRPQHGALLAERGILYAPDYVINAGGRINVYGELNGWSSDRAKRKAGEIYSTLINLFELSRENGLPSYQAADLTVSPTLSTPSA